MKRRLGESGNEEQGSVGKDKGRGGDSVECYEVTVKG